VKPAGSGLIESNASRDGRHHSAGMTARAESLGMTGRTHPIIARRCSSMVVREIRTVDEVIVGQRALVLQVLVAGVAVLRRKLSLVPVAAQAVGHARPHDGRARAGIGVAPHAVSARRVGMRAVVESQCGLRAKRAVARIG
jgi:hypothetical protein